MSASRMSQFLEQRLILALGEAVVELLELCPLLLEFLGCVRDRLCGDSDGDLPGGDDALVLHDSALADDAPLADLGVIAHYGAHPDDAPVLHAGGVDYGRMADGDMVIHAAHLARSRVHD